MKENHSNSKRELQSVIDQLEEQLQSQQTNEGALKSEIESLKAELVERSKLETYIKELEEKISKNILVAKEVRHSLCFRSVLGMIIEIIFCFVAQIDDLAHVQNVDFD